MLKIEKVNKEEGQVVRFEENEWHKLDLKHYGQPIAKYMDKEFHYVAKEGKEIRGTVKGKYELGVVYVSSLIVAEKSRGQGLGG